MSRYIPNYIKPYLKKVKSSYVIDWVELVKQKSRQHGLTEQEYIRLLGIGRRWTARWNNRSFCRQLATKIYLLKIFKMYKPYAKRLLFKEQYVSPKFREKKEG